VIATSVRRPYAIGHRPPVTISNANGYSYQRTLTIDPLEGPQHRPIQLPGAHQWNLSVSRHERAKRPGKVSSPSAYDVIFTSDIGCRVKLNHELDQWNASTGQFLGVGSGCRRSRHSADTNVYMCYGQSFDLGGPEQLPKLYGIPGTKAVWQLPVERRDAHCARLDG